MIPLRSAVVVEWAAACHNRALYRDPPGPVSFLGGGRERLLRLAEELAAGLPGTASPEERDDYVWRVARLAVGLREGVFATCGAETARGLALCLLAAARFRRRSREGLDLGALLEAIEAQGPDDVADRLRADFKYVGDEGAA
jgi:hypothetical protein